MSQVLSVNAEATRSTSSPKGDGRGASIGLATLNARYVHLALSLRCLRNAAREAGFANTWVAEYTVRTPAWKIAGDLLARRPRVLGFSVYIWNRRETLEVIELLKKQAPHLLVVVGGPEVSFDATPPPYADVLISGEGERKWVECLTLWARGEVPDSATRRRWKAFGADLPELERPPYLEEDLAGLEHRLVYLETSRGCPYTCAFCLSALDENVRFLPMEPVKATISQLVEAGARRIKFLDRTFNLGRARLREWFSWLARFEGVSFHFEVVGELLDEEMLTLLDQAPPGRFQFEIGVQTVFPEIQQAIARRQDGERLFSVVRRLVAAGRVHLHLDLIWGLPGENLAMIRRAFEEVISLHPHELQLGFLKFLPGAPIQALAEPYGYVFQDHPPYEMIANRNLSASEVAALKQFEEVFDRYHNSGRFRFTLSRIFEVRPPWEVFETLARHFAQHGLFIPALGQDELRRLLMECSQGWLPKGELEDLLRLDHFFHQRVRRPPPGLGQPDWPEPPAARARRKADPNCVTVPFGHHIEVTGQSARLVPASVPAWYAFTYPEEREGYFFRPRMEALHD